MTKEQSVLKSITEVFEGENMQTQYSVLDYKIGLYFYDYELAVETDEKGHKDRNTNDKIQRQKALERFIRINPDEKHFNINKANNEIFRHIKEPTKEITINSVKRLLKAAFMFKNNNIISNFTRKFIKHLLPTLSKK